MASRRPNEMWLLFRRIILAGSFLLAAALAAGWAYNNLRAAIPKADFLSALDGSMERGHTWLASQERETTPGLQFMLADMRRARDDRDLTRLAHKFLAETPQPWGRVADSKWPFELPPAGYLERLPEYQRWHLYALAPGQVTLPEFERQRFFRQAAYTTGELTHHTIGLLMHRQTNGPSPEVDAGIRADCERIAREAALDFRVTDLYYQRIGVLLSAGYPDLVHPKWIERIISNQGADGGWVVNWYGWDPSPQRFHFGESETVSHSSIQALWVLYLIRYRYPAWIDKHYR